MCLVFVRVVFITVLIISIIYSPTCVCVSVPLICLLPVEVILPMVPVHCATADPALCMCFRVLYRDIDWKQQPYFSYFWPLLLQMTVTMHQDLVCSPFIEGKHYSFPWTSRWSVRLEERYALLIFLNCWHQIECASIFGIWDDPMTQASCPDFIVCQRCRVFVTDVRSC